MGKRRTRHDKATAKHEYQYHFEGVAVDREKTERITATTLYGYEPKLIRWDIIKTIMVTFAILLLEIGLYRFWR